MAKLMPVVQREEPDSDPALEVGLDGEDLLPMTNEEIDRAIALQACVASVMPPSSKS